MAKFIDVITDEGNVFVNVEQIVSVKKIDTRQTLIETVKGDVKVNDTFKSVGIVIVQ